MEAEAGPHPAYEQGMAGPPISNEQMQTMQQEFVALRDISNQTHLQVQQLQEANRCANAQLQQWADHSRLQAEQFAAFQNREVEPHSHGDANGPRNLNKPGGRSIRFESCDGRNSETTKAWFAMSRTRLLATGIDPNTKDAVLHLASFFTGPLGRWWTTTIRGVDDACGNFGSIAELEEAAMSLHYIRDPCRTAYHKLSRLKQTGSVHQFKQALEELHFHMPERSDKCKLYDFIEGLKPHVREKVVIDFPESLAIAIRRALELDDNVRENYSDNSSKHAKNWNGNWNGNWKKRNQSNNFYRRNFSNNYSNQNFYNPANGAPQSSGPVPMELGHAGVATPGQRPGLRLGQAERQKLKKTGACFYCRQQGHTIKQCPMVAGQQGRGIKKTSKPGGQCLLQHRRRNQKQILVSPPLPPPPALANLKKPERRFSWSRTSKLPRTRAFKTNNYMLITCLVPSY